MQSQELRRSWVRRRHRDTHLRCLPRPRPQIEAWVQATKQARLFRQPDEYGCGQSDISRGLTPRIQIGFPGGNWRQLGIYGERRPGRGVLARLLLRRGLVTEGQ